MNSIKLKNMTYTVTYAKITASLYHIISEVPETNTEIELKASKNIQIALEYNSERTATNFDDEPGNSREKVMIQRNIICHCSEVDSQTPNYRKDQNDLDKIDPISGLTNGDTILKRHPNLGRQVLSEGPRCNLIPYITK